MRRDPGKVTARYEWEKEWGQATEKRTAIYRHLRISVPEEPEADHITVGLLNVFRNASRSRRYLVGATTVQPLRLTVRDVSDWLDAHPLPLPRGLVDEVIFALDEVALAQDDED